jgi:RES domain-containing protein
MADSALPTVNRSGRYFRVCKPEWVNGGDMSFSKRVGGRWNPPGEFGALYLNATVRLAAAQARHQHEGRAIALFDLRPERRPMLASFDVPPVTVVDVVTAEAIRSLGLPATYPVDVAWEACRQIARAAYQRGLAGVAARSAAEARVNDVVGEELAYFDAQPALDALDGKAFAEWYPDPHPA